MLNLTDHLRRLKVDKYEYVAMKVIVLLSSGKVHLHLFDWNVEVDRLFFICSFADTAELKEPEKVRASQEKALQALQAYTLGSLLFIALVECFADVFLFQVITQNHPQSLASCC